MIELSNISLPLDAGLPGEAGKALVRAAAAKACGVPVRDVRSVRLAKRSVDARKKSDVHFVATLDVELASDGQEQRVIDEGPFVRGVQAKRRRPYEPLDIPDCSAFAAPSGRAVPNAAGEGAHAGGFVRPVVVGTGPAGLFCALYLARAGLRPLVVERGGYVEERSKAVDAFAAGAPIDVHSNIQFGEGGAGTFSDGKLTTNTKNPLTKHVLAWFAQAGAPHEILWQAKPHIGTDKLRGVVRTMRQQIIDAGGEVRFHTQLVGLVLDGVDGPEASDASAFQGANQPAHMRVSGVRLRDTRTGEPCVVPATHVVVACGHSARDTFHMLRDAGFVLQQKPFSVGVRIEHPQALVNESQYGAAAGHPALGAADYKLAVHLPNGRGVYTFCMCPGGEVVAAVSEEGAVCVNGMSRFARDGRNANSAVLVGIDPADFGSDDALAGIDFQRTIERAAYETAVRAGGAPYSAPAQTVGDFLVPPTCRSAEPLDAAEGSGTHPGRLHACPHVPKYARPHAAAIAGTGALLADSTNDQGAENPSSLTDYANLEDDAAATAEGSGTVIPTYPRGVAWCDLRECLPDFVAESIAQALPLMDRKLAGFAHPDAVMTGVETRSSSPVRVCRGDDLQAVGVAGVYPCGEGAGYAGGIMSAAVDGLRVAIQIAESLDCGTGL